MTSIRSHIITSGNPDVNIVHILDLQNLCLDPSGADYIPSVGGAPAGADTIGPAKKVLIRVRPYGQRLDDLLKRKEEGQKTWLGWPRQSPWPAELAMRAGAHRTGTDAHQFESLQTGRAVKIIIRSPTWQPWKVPDQRSIWELVRR
jgi:hypothetical protein